MTNNKVNMNLRFLNMSKEEFEEYKKKDILKFVGKLILAGVTFYGVGKLIERLLE